jgi:hypothetical protein
MGHWLGTIRIFGEIRLRDYLEDKKSTVIRSIESENDDYLLNVNESDYISYRSSKAFIEPLQIHEDQIYASSSEKMIQAEVFPRGIPVHAGKSYRKDVIKFHVPFTGNTELLKCIPSRRILWSIDVEVVGAEFCFEIINFRDDPAEIKREKDSNMQSIMEQCRNVESEKKTYNASIKAQIQHAFEVRKQRILAKSDVMASLGVPIKKTEDVPATFSVPTPQTRRKVAVSRPIVNEQGFKPEPSLDDTVYNYILQLIHDVGKEFERLPSLYAGKEEEHLRDHFLMMLIKKTGSVRGNVGM